MTRAEVTTRVKSASREDNADQESSKKNMKETNDSQLGSAPKKKGKTNANKGKMMDIPQEKMCESSLEKKGESKNIKKVKLMDTPVDEWISC